MKRILIMTDHRLYPIDNGAIVRTIEQARFLSRNDYDVHLIGHRQPRARDNNSIIKVKTITGANVYTHSESLLRSGMSHAFRRARAFGLQSLCCDPFVAFDVSRLFSVKLPDIIQCEYFCIAQQILRIAKRHDTPIVLSQHNVESHRLILEGSVAQRHIRKLRDLESRICNSVDYVTTVSEADRTRLIELGVNTDIEVVPNGVDYLRYQISRENREKTRRHYNICQDDVVLVFHGTLYYPPNVEATNTLKRIIFPKLKRRFRNLKLLLIGPGHISETSDDIIQLPAINYELFPTYLSMGDVAVVPLTAGSGTRLKILEYLALGIPTVTTKIGAEGLPVVNGREIIVAPTDENLFIEDVERLLIDKRLQEQMAGTGKKLVRERLDWNTVFKSYLNIYDRVLEKKS